MSAASDFDPEFASAGQWAWEYRSYGLQIVPAYLPSSVAKGKPWKRPLFAQWTEFQETLVPDSVFERWYGLGGEYTSHLNMGVICGRASGNVFVTDLDIQKPGSGARQWWAGLLAVHNNNLDIETVEQQTGGGGLQKLFRAPKGWHCPTNRTSIGVDIRGQGGFAVLPPSIHDSGKNYEWLIGRSLEDLAITMAPDWLLEAVERLVAAHGGDIQSSLKTRTASPSGDFDAFGHQHDGREEKMRDLVWGAVVDWYRECPIKPGEPEQRTKAAEKYLVYEGLVVSRLSDPAKTKTELLEQEGRGPTEFWGKWQTALKHWDGKVREEAAKPNPKSEEEPRYRDYGDEFAKARDDAEEQAKANPVNQFEYLDIVQIKTMPNPRWLVDKLVVEQALGFIYGPPGCLKTFIALDMALSFTTGQAQWWGRDIQRKGAVVYISSEGQADLKFRIMVWEQHRKAIADNSPFFLIRQNINFMKGEDIGTLLATVETIAGKTGMPIVAVFVDTVSRVLPGAEENLQKDMSLFVAACDAVRQRFGATVFGVHHTSRAGNMRGSTVIPGAGDFIIEVRREPGAMAGSIFVEKIKAAEDGWEQCFKVEKVTLSDISGTVSLVVDPVETALKKDLGWPDIDVCRQILAAIDEQWKNGRPWCFAQNTSRSAIVNIMNRWRLKREVVVDILNKWNAEDVIAEEIYNSHNHIQGYRKLASI